ncbi:MAG: recombinase family protein, partial [Patescibacteria group bacterium]|nr:recombinase family protein [Patescibacteria group bacterium]
MKSERSKNGLRARFLAGLYTGPAPLGYLNTNGYITKYPEYWDKVKAAWELMATGSKTLREMADWMNAQGLRAKIRGKEYEICHQLAGRVFRNKFYTGVVQSKKYGHEVPGQHPPMISEEMYYKVQAILDGRNTNIHIPLVRRNPDNPDFPLRRIVKCQRCGTIFTGAWSKGQRAKYAYYFCKKRCGGPSVAKDVLEHEMLHLLNRITPKQQTIDLLIAFIRKTYYERVATLNKRREEANTQLKKCYETRQALIEKNLAGVYSDDVFKEQNRLLEEKIKDIQITKNDEMVSKYNLEAIITFLKEKFEHLARTYLESTLEQKKVLLCSTMPLGAFWTYPGLSNTQLSPYFQAIL